MKPRPLLVATALCTTLAAAAQGLPELGDASSASLSDSQERTIGRRIMREVRTDSTYVDDPEISDYVSQLGARLLAASDGSRRDLEFFVLTDESINAFALVGGHIGLHTGLIALTSTESELAGVMAHEIAHILQRHQARAMHGQRGSSIAALAALAVAVLASRGSGTQGGQIAEAAITSASALMIQNQLDYTREHEREADRVGLALLERSGQDTRGMASFFEKLLRANRLNEFKGVPAYLRTHPLTTERIADLQDRTERMPSRFVADPLEYRIIRAKIRAMAGTSAEAVNYFRRKLEDATVMRAREDVYGLAYSLRRARNFEGAWKELSTIRTGKSPTPAFSASVPAAAFELLAGQLQADLGKPDEALKTYQEALRSYPQHRGLVYEKLTLQMERGRHPEVLADLQERLRNVQDDARLYELQARAYEATGKRIGQHRALAEAYFRRGNLAAAAEQLELAVKVKNADFYEISSAEFRLREIRVLLENERAAEKALKIT